MTSHRKVVAEPTIRPGTLQEVDGFFWDVCKSIGGGIIVPGLLDSDRLRFCDEFFVAEWNGQIVGAVTLAIFKAERLPTLDVVYVRPALRGKRVGPRLVETAIRRFKEAKRTPILCDVTSKDMHRLIERLPPDLRTELKAVLSYVGHGDEWDEWKCNGF